MTYRWKCFRVALPRRRMAYTIDLAPDIPPFFFFLKQTTCRIMVERNGLHDKASYSESRAGVYAAS